MLMFVFKVSQLHFCHKSVAQPFLFLFCRFLGTTPKSSTILQVLKSIMLQIKHVYKFAAKIPRVSERF